LERRASSPFFYNLDIYPQGVYHTPMKKQNLKIVAACCGDNTTSNPDHSPELHRLSRIQGQLEGIKKMISERRYCPDIITQTSAVRSAITSLEAAILEKHLSACVKEAFKASDRESDTKIQELLEIFKRSTK
jgi:DNA-binding FrmR family transcriptional regulator